MNPYLPREAQVMERLHESPSIFTLRLRVGEGGIHFAPGQFNMLYLYGVGEVPISIVSDPTDERLLDHTIRSLGRVTRGLEQLQAGDRVGLRGPFGRGWPVREAEGRNLLVVTGGLGCAPVVAVINYVLLRRERFGRLTIIQGVKHVEDLIWRNRYEYWRTLPNVEVLIAADHGGPLWPYHVGLVTQVFDRATISPDSFVMLCGPEPMMQAAIPKLTARGVSEDSIWLSMERNMHCAVAHCGHCQFGPRFVCRDGPVFPYPEVKDLLGVRGF